MLTRTVFRVAIIMLWNEESLKSRNELFKLDSGKGHCTPVKLFYEEKNRTEKLGKRHTAPLCSSSQSTAKNNVWYYQQVILRFSVCGKHNTSAGNWAKKLMAIFKLCNGSVRPTKERPKKHTDKNPNT